MILFIILIQKFFLLGTDQNKSYVYDMERRIYLWKDMGRNGKKKINKLETYLKAEWVKIK